MTAFALTGLQLDEVSLVDVGAVRRRFALSKRHGGDMAKAKARKDDMPMGAPSMGGASSDPDEVLEGLLATPMSNEADIDQALAGLPAEARAGVIGGLRVMSGYADQLGEADYQTIMAILTGKPAGDGADATSETPQDAPTKDDSGSDASADDDSADKGADTREEDEDMPTETTKAHKAEIERLAKAHKDAVAKADARAAAAEARTEKIEKALAAEREVAEHRSCIEKAQKEFPNCGDAAELGSLLKSLKGDDRARLETHLRATEARLSKSALFGTAGHSQGNPEPLGAEADLHKAADAIMKSDPKLRYPQAVDRALRQDRGLYNRIEAEKLSR